MKIIFAGMLLLGTSAWAQASSFRVASACGPKNVSFNVKLDDSRHTPALPEPGKAMVYFIQDDGPWGKYQHYVIRIGIDGTWVGAYKWNSYFSVSVEPGVHHVCTNVQSNYPKGRLIALAHFTADPGKTYYFRTRFLSGMNGMQIPPYVDLEPVDSDEAKYLISYYPLSISSSKK